ncbi:MAG: response regulator transcription factor [Candidatus Dormibacteria bacterium]
MARLLVVEDEPNIAEIILFKLRREGHEVTHVESAAEGGALTGPWDLVLLDSSLPGEDALQALEALGMLAPVAVMTESRDTTTAPLAREAGACAIVPKPFKPTLLARLVLEITSGKGDANHSIAAASPGLIADMETAL